MADIIEIKQADTLQAITKSEVDIQIATAKQYPRDIQAVLNKIETYATMDTETAQDCFYVLRRNGAYGQNNIEGLSVRMAEIIASAWGNIRVQTRIIANDGKTVTVQGVCHDLETNEAVCIDVPRRITDKNGRTFSEDMQVVTANAASAIAFRNAVLKVVPKAVTKKVIERVKKVAMGQALDLEQQRQNMIQYFAKLGVTEAQLLEYLDIKKREEIDKEAVFELRATANAIKEGTTTIQEAFLKPLEERHQAAEAKQKAIEAKEIAEIAMQRAKNAKVLNVDKATGEVTEGEKK